MFCGANAPARPVPRPGRPPESIVTPIALLTFFDRSVVGMHPGPRIRRTPSTLPETGWPQAAGPGLRPRGEGDLPGVVAVSEVDAVVDGTGQGGGPVMRHDSGHGGVNAPGGVAAFLGQPGPGRNPASPCGRRRRNPAPVDGPARAVKWPRQSTAVGMRCCLASSQFGTARPAGMPTLGRGCSAGRLMVQSEAWPRSFASSPRAARISVRRHEERLCRSGKGGLVLQLGSSWVNVMLLRRAAVSHRVAGAGPAGQLW